MDGKDEGNKRISPKVIKMLSLDYNLSVPKYPSDEIGSQTLVRVNNAELRVQFTNDGSRPLSALTVSPVVESYVGQDKPILFLRLRKQNIEKISPRSMIELSFNIWAIFPGLISVAIYVADASNNTIIMKRKEDTAYEQQPIRWWFHVVDNIAIENLRALKSLAIQKRKKIQ